MFPIRRHVGKIAHSCEHWAGDLMYRVAIPSARRANGAGGSVQKTCKTLLIVAPADFVSECLVFAIEREFPSIAVEQVATLAEACVSFECPVSLILLDAGQLPDVAGHSERISHLHPAAQIMLIQEDGRHEVSIRDVVTARNVRGVLPMNLKLDVWLSVVRLVLRGGEYFPLSLFEPIIERRTTVATAFNEVVVPKAVVQADGDTDDFDELTDRELQILGMVARGLQNKLIAAALGLSEHTVKIHLHNIITKLGAHNRTEAAAIFHGRRGETIGERDIGAGAIQAQLPLGV
ncbi:helix-turn-helix transcriptional regulator [Aminobacter niigataensis]|uniref:DNA-binding NarL/FixJ family response regulator n=1 Tax=Aminobacter niigataensis TaxID=83265 RepID=A0ABR6L8G3_9HYPH|nr:response regulator transcription factor [Aminobacter niigataensis]MBB4653090.1 DNA-binding NarL/FixJ family response regulator [Aminobacter niigataensis]